MNDHIAQDILDELRKHTRQNQFNMRATVAALAILLVFVLMLPVLDAIKAHKRCPPEQRATWSASHTAFDDGNYEKAIELTQTMIQKNPGYYFGYTRLATAYQAKGDLPNAEANFLKAYELYPSEENEKALTTIRKVLTSERK